MKEAMTKRRQSPAIAGYPQAPRPVAVLRESDAECSGTLCLRRRGRAGPSCRDGPQSSSPWYRPGGSCRRQAIREPWRCHATKAFAAPAARRGQVEAWNLIRKLKMLSSFQMSLPNTPKARACPKSIPFGWARNTPQIEKQTYPPHKMHQVCTNRAEIREKMTKSEELGAPEWREKRAVSQPRAASARRSPAESLPRRS